MKKSKVSFRIGFQQWMDEECLDALYSLFQKYKDIIDEVAFFTSDTHAPLPIDIFEERINKLEGIIQRFRNLKLTAGINILTTMGHHEENLDGSLNMPWQRLVSPDGKECRGCYCPQDKNMQGYIEKIYELSAKANPDFIWIDDDVRLYGHIPILCGCFCERCLYEFSYETGENWTRERFFSMLDGGSIDEKLGLRKKWLEHNRKLINGILLLAEKSAHRVNNKLAIGFMTGNRFYEGYDFERWAKTLRGKDDTPVMWRPGGGFYDEKIPSELAGKAHDIGRQVSMLPDYVTDIQSEIENFPYQRLRKSVHTTILEAAVDLGAGSTGTAFNILSQSNEPLDEYLPFLDRVKLTRSFYDLVVSTFQRNPCEGLWFAWNKDIFTLEGLTGGWFKTTGEFYNWGEKLYEFSELGIPYSYSQKGAKVTAFAGNSPLIFDREEIKGIMSGGVIMDVPALKCLWDMGLGEWTGFKPKVERADDSIEVLTDHLLNGSFAGRRRDCRQSFKWWGAEPAYVIEPVSKNSQVIATMIDYAGKDCGVSMGIFENSLGGRVAVSGYYPWKMVHNLSKSTQVKTIIRWLSKDAIPAYVHSFEKVNIWCRKTIDGEYGISLLNQSFDDIDELEIVILTKKDVISVFDMDCQETKIIRHTVNENRQYGLFKITNLKSWTVVLIR